MTLVDCGHPSGCRCEDVPLERVGCSYSTMALIRAGQRVRGGLPDWLKGAPSHVLAELLTELEKDGFVLARKLSGSAVPMGSSPLTENLFDAIRDVRAQRTPGSWTDAERRLFSLLPEGSGRTSE